MGTLINMELAELRRTFVRDEIVIDYTKPVINAAFQAVEDIFETARPNIQNAIETASPGVFNITQKNKLIKTWLRHKLGVS